MGKRILKGNLDIQGTLWSAEDIYVGSESGLQKDEGSVRLARIDEVVSIEILETPKDGEILVYDAASNKLVNSGFTIDSLKQWVKDYIETYMSEQIIIDNNGNQILSVTGKETVIDNPDGSQTLIIGG